VAACLGEGSKDAREWRLKRRLEPLRLSVTADAARIVAMVGVTGGRGVPKERIMNGMDRP
jgi:hypothetical protein